MQMKKGLTALIIPLYHHSFPFHSLHNHNYILHRRLVHATPLFNYFKHTFKVRTKHQSDQRKDGVKRDCAFNLINLL